MQATNISSSSINSNQINQNNVSFMPHTFYTQTHTQKLSVIFDRSKNDAKDSPILCTLSYIFFFCVRWKKTYFSYLLHTLRVSRVIYEFTFIVDLCRVFFTFYFSLNFIYYLTKNWSFHCNTIYSITYYRRNF